jgi:hypothetical protein
MNLTLDFSVDAHTERKLNDKFELKNSKTQNKHRNVKLINRKASLRLNDHNPTEMN